MQRPYLYPTTIREDPNEWEGPPPLLVQAPAAYRPRRVIMGEVRSVASKGTAPFSPYQRDTWSGKDEEANLASELDDTVGNGIFDGHATPAVQNAGNGIFEEKYSEPGYLYRERLTEPGSIVDYRTGTPIVSLPAGTSWASELAAAYRPWDQETPRYYGTAIAVVRGATKKG